MDNKATNKGEWVSVEDVSQLPFVADFIDCSIDVIAKCGKFHRRAYYDFFLKKWYWIKKNEDTVLIHPTHYRIPSPPNK